MHRTEPRLDLRGPPTRAFAAVSPRSLAVLALALAACGGAGGAPGGAGEVSRTATADAAVLGTRADAATGALVARFWDGGTADFAHGWPSNGAPAGYWV
jgi:hypothetical protein